MSFPIWRIFQVEKRIYFFAHSVMKSFFTSPPGPVNSIFSENTFEGGFEFSILTYVADECV
jgi:hypothetical protein